MSSSRLLAQIRPSGTTAVTGFTATSPTTVYYIHICNTTGSSVNFSIYIDIDGNTYDETTAYVFSDVINPNEPIDVEFLKGAQINNKNGTIGVQTSSANALTFSIFGLENKTL